MVAVMIGVDPHKASHTAVAISAIEEPLGELRVRACAAQAEQLLEWAQSWPERTWAVEGADGVGHLLAEQLLSAGERVLDVQPKLAARVRLLATGDINKNDPNDARSVAVAALRSPGVREAGRDDHAAVLKVWSKCLFLNLGEAAPCGWFVIFGQRRRAFWRVSGAPGSHGGDQTSQHHQEPWCQSALPWRRVHAPAQVAAARAAIPPMPVMRNGRCCRRCCRSRRVRPSPAGGRRGTAAGRWWTRSGM
jgi:Transposase